MSSKKILVVDDDMICRKAVSNFAKKHEITADAAESGAEAIELVKNNQYAIIMIDLFMPGMDGYQTAQQIRGLPNGANTKLVVMSGDELEKSEYEQHGFSFYMPKPVGKKAFETLLQSVGM